MGQLIRANIIPLKTVHYSQPGRLVSSDSIDVERRKAIARHNAMRANYAASIGANDYRYIQQINQAFSHHKQTTVQAGSQMSAVQSHSVSPQTANPTGMYPQKTAASAPASQTAYAEQTPTASNAASVPSENSQGISESQAAYTIQRGSFELRVAKGELSYLPPLDMTIIVQYPGIEFEYLGDFNYVPSRENDESNIDSMI